MDIISSKLRPAIAAHLLRCTLQNLSWLCCDACAARGHCNGRPHALRCPAQPSGDSLNLTPDGTANMVVQTVKQLVADNAYQQSGCVPSVATTGDCHPDKSRRQQTWLTEQPNLYLAVTTEPWPRHADRGRRLMPLLVTSRTSLTRRCSCSTVRRHQAFTCYL